MKSQKSSNTTFRLKIEAYDTDDRFITSHEEDFATVPNLTKEGIYDYMATLTSLCPKIVKILISEMK